MPRLTTEDVAGLSSSDALDRMQERHRELASIREKHGTLAGVKGPEADTVIDLNADLGLLGERLDTARELEGADDSFTRFGAFLNEPEDHPGHGNGQAAAAKVERLRKGVARDIGGLFVESDAWKAFQEDGRLDVPVQLPIESLWPGYKGIGEVPSDGVLIRGALFDTGDFPSAPDFITTPVDVLFQPNNIGPLMAQGTTNAATIRYPVETIVATGAAETAEGATKPEAEINFTPVDEPVRKIAVMLPLTDESLEDNGFLRAWINARLRLFVQNREDAQLLNGNGTAPNIRGLLNRSGINTATSYSIGGTNPDQALIDAVFKAAMRVRDVFLEPDNAVMAPSTWELARLAKDGNRQYLLGPPSDEAPQRLWGLRVVLNANMPAQLATNKPVLVGAFRTAAMLVRRTGIELAATDSHGEFFAENKIAIRAEERVALVVFRPQGFAAVTSAA